MLLCIGLSLYADWDSGIKSISQVYDGSIPYIALYQQRAPIPSLDSMHTFSVSAAQPWLMINEWVYNLLKGHERCAHTLIWSIMSCFCAYKREQSGHLKTDTFWFSMCWSKWRYSRVCRVKTVSHMEHLYITLQQKKCVEMSVSPRLWSQRNCYFTSQEFRWQGQWEHINTVKRTKQFSFETIFWRQLASLKCRSVLTFWVKTHSITFA